MIARVPKARMESGNLAQGFVLSSVGRTGSSSRPPRSRIHSRKAREVPSTPPPNPARGGESGENLDGLRQYFRDVSRFPLLSPEEEIEVFRRVREGDPEAARRAVEANLRLVVKVARRYLDQGLPYLDLIQEGNQGLIDAVYRFDPERGNRFATLAVWRIRKDITRALSNRSRMIRVPVYQVERHQQIQKVIEDLQGELGRNPDEAEVAERSGISLEKVRQTLAVTQKVTSLDKRTQAGSALGEVLVDPEHRDMVEGVIRSDLRSVLAEAMQVLRPREKEVVGWRFGTDGREPLTLEKIGRKIGVTRERARQILRNALRRIASSPQADNLRAFLAPSFEG